MQRRPRVENEKHLAFVRSLPCLVTGRTGTDAAHIRYSDLRVAKRKVGIGEKPDDRWVVPLCREEHMKQHSMSEKQYWHNVGIDPILIALALYAVSGDNEMGEIIVANAKG